MSFDNSSSFAQWQSSLASGSDRNSQKRDNRPPQSVWGQPAAHAGSRRGLTPLATSNINVTSGVGTRRAGATDSPGASNSTTSPVNSNFPSLLTSNRIGGNRQISSSTSSSPFPPLQTGGQQHRPFSPNQPVISPRSRTITPLSQIVGASANSYAQTGPGAGGGGGGPGAGPGARSGTYSPSPVGGSLISLSNFGAERSGNQPLSASSNTSGQSSLSKISVAQVLLLVDTITEKEGKAKWESKAEQIRKLVDSNGMDVFSPYIKRLVSKNASVIFSGTKVSDSGSYNLLQDEMQKVLREPDQASKIAESIDTSEGDVYRDFNLTVFIEHFHDEPIAKCVLAVAFRNCTRPDLRNKAELYLSENIAALVRSLKPQGTVRPVDPLIMAALIESLATSPPRKLDLDQKEELEWSVRRRYQDLGSPLPAQIASALALLSLNNDNQTFMQRLKRLGPKSTATQDASEDLLASIGYDKLNETEVANVLLFMALSLHSAEFKPGNFVAAIRSKSRVKRVDWQLVLSGFDIPNLHISIEGFLLLFKALMPLAEESTFDIQALWGGVWQFPETQLSFLEAYLCCASDDIDISRIPNVRLGFSTDTFANAPEDLTRHAETLSKSHVASLDALRAFFDLALVAESPSKQKEIIINLFVQTPENISILVLSLPQFQPPWTEYQREFMTRCFNIYLQKQSADYKVVLNGLYRQSPDLTIQFCHQVFSNDPLKTELIVEMCGELGWTDEFLKQWHMPLALDIACVRHRDYPEFDLEKYLRDIVDNQAENENRDFGTILSKFFNIKIKDELRTQRKEQLDPQSVPLALKTVHILLLILEDQIKDPERLSPLQRLCLQTYPRLINYGEGFDEILDRSSDENGHKLPEEADKKMSELFGQMYRGEMSIREVIERMNEHKTSQNPDDQDLFCCVVHGLFDEYSCFSEYPLDALITTAVLFGSVINFRLISGHTLHVGLHLILDAIREYQPEELMFKFGVEALEQLRDRLPEWPGYCGFLVQIPSLQGSDIAQRAAEILRERGHGLGDEAEHPAVNGIGDPLSMTNGGFEDFLAPENLNRTFKSMRAEPPIKGRFQDPEPPVQEKILFVINNTSNDNLATKIKDLDEVLQENHYQWFASYLVEQRARLEPNNQEMYVRLLETINSKTLLAEVLRETYICGVRMINAESTMGSAQERSHLKNLGGWLGSLTIAKDRPIKHKNIYFTELLIEGHRSERLPVVIPFTCKVLVQGSRSTVFKPPNPWLMEIIGLLMELYDNVADLKLNLKFEIEVLCKDIGLDHKKVERTSILQDQTHHFDDDLTNVSGQPDGLEMFDDMPLTGMNRAIRQRLSPAVVMAKLQTLGEQLKYPPGSSGGPNQELVKNIIYRAFEQAIQEIINPVVERSITIASISTAQLISKDYATEVNEEKYRFAARQMVKTLAGNLALVTCKEPLRMSITNYIRKPTGGDYAEQLIPEGALIMCVNDNLDLACSLIAEAAEENSIAEIDAIIEPDLEDRRRYLAENSDRPFVNRHIPRWATFIPEPYKQIPGGLNETQQAVYDEFDRRLQGVGTNLTQNVSGDSTGRQIQDVLQESLAMANMSTPAEQPVLPHHISLVQDEARASNLQQPRINGFSAALPVTERIFGLITNIHENARTSSADRLKTLDKGSGMFSDIRQIFMIIKQSARPPPELLARQVAEKLCQFLLSDLKSTLEVDIFVFILGRLCDMSDMTNRDIFKWLVAQDESLISNISMTVALVQHGFIELTRIDTMIRLGLQQRKIMALQLFSTLMDEILFNEEPIALRADFVGSLEAMNQWFADEPEIDFAVDINNKLKASGMPTFVAVAMTDKTIAQQDQMRYIFLEWIKLYQSPTSGHRAYSSFIKELHQKQIINTREDSVEFIRLCIDSCIESFQLEAERGPRASLNAAFLHTDALARLIMMLVKLQGESNGAVKMLKGPYLESTLSLIVLIVNHHQVTRGVDFNQRIFFRLFSSLLYEYWSNDLSSSPEHKEMMIIFANTFLLLQPRHFPAFMFGWLGLISHRVFVKGLLSMTNEVGWEAYRRLIEIMLQEVTRLLDFPPFMGVVVELYRGAVKVLLMLLHDYPDFLSENHYSLCNQIPYHCTQLRNIVLNARPQTEQEVYDVSQPGLKVDRLDEVKRAPVIAGDISAPISRKELKSVIDGALHKGGPSPDSEASVRQICDVIVEAPQQSKMESLSDSHVISKPELLSSLVLYLGSEALASYGRFDPASPQTAFFHKLMQSLPEESRYALINALIDQVRFPNSHTNYFMKLTLHIFGLEHLHQQDQNIREQILRVLLERLVPHRPHPWGLVVLYSELEQNSSYRVWDLPFISAAPFNRQLIGHAARLAQH